MPSGTRAQTATKSILIDPSRLSQLKEPAGHLDDRSSQTARWIEGSRHQIPSPMASQDPKFCNHRPEPVRSDHGIRWAFI